MGHLCLRLWEEGMLEPCIGPGQLSWCSHCERSGAIQRQSFGAGEGRGRGKVRRRGKLAGPLIRAWTTVCCGFYSELMGSWASVLIRL